MLYKHTPILKKDNLDKDILSNCRPIRINNTTSDKSEIFYGVPQGSVLGPLRFTLYMSPISDIIERFSQPNISMDNGNFNQFLHCL
jgi:hypothetical protein